jgi:DNA mismatch repair protein MutH
MASSAPPTVDALVDRVRGLVGVPIATIAQRLGVPIDASALRTKGTSGQLLERALGATGGAQRVVDFDALGVELKSVPIDRRGVPLESTHVCTLSLADADTQTWPASWARAKLACVLFVPLVGDDGDPWHARRVGEPRLWSPTPEQARVLEADFDDIVGLIGAGGVERVSAHLGRWLQLRPKARDGRARTIAWDRDGEPIATVPRGFYLRARFVGAILRDPCAMPE